MNNFPGIVHLFRLKILVLFFRAILNTLEHRSNKSLFVFAAWVYHFVNFDNIFDKFFNQKVVIQWLYGNETISAPRKNYQSAAAWRRHTYFGNRMRAGCCRPRNSEAYWPWAYFSHRPISTGYPISSKRVKKRNCIRKVVFSPGVSWRFWIG